MQPLRLRQVALVAHELSPTVEALCDVLGIDVAYRDPGVAVFGLENAVMPIGDTFLEVVSPAKPGTTAGRFLERRGGDAGYMAIFQTDDLPAARERAKAAGVRIAWETTLEDAATVHLHPRDLGGAIVSLDWMDPPESWRWAGPTWRERVRTERVLSIAGVELAAEDPEAMATRWAAVLDRPVEAGLDDVPQIEVDGGAVRFGRSDGPNAEGVVGLAVRARDPEAVLAAGRDRGLEVADGAVRLCGVALRPVPAA